MDAFATLESALARSRRAPVWPPFIGRRCVRDPRKRRTIRRKGVDVRLCPDPHAERDRRAGG